jgi:hypothetical protein
LADYAVGSNPPCEFCLAFRIPDKAPSPICCCFRQFTFAEFSLARARRLPDNPPPVELRLKVKKVSGPRASLSEDDEYEPDDYPSPAAAKLLRPPRRSFAAPILVFAGVAMLAAFAVSRPDKPKPQPEIEAAAPPKEQQRMTEQQTQPAPPAEPFKSLVLDAAQSYLATGGRTAATVGRSR